MSDSTTTWYVILPDGKPQEVLASTPIGGGLPWAWLRDRPQSDVTAETLEGGCREAVTLLAVRFRWPIAQILGPNEGPPDDSVASLRERLRTTGLELSHYKSREAHFASQLAVCDGGRHRNDWNAAIKRVLSERDESRQENERLRREIAWLRGEPGSQPPGCACDDDDPLLCHGSMGKRDNEQCTCECHNGRPVQ